jgi:nucleoid DNA-binding protein
MKQAQLAKTLARKANLTSAAARDRVDEIVHKILKKLKSGQSVKLAGMGKLIAKPLKRPR